MAARKLQHYIKTYRKRTGLTQKELGYLIGHGDGTKVSRIERCRRSIALEEALALHVIFRIPLRELFAGYFEQVEQKTIDRIGLLACELHSGESTKHTEHKLDALAVAVRGIRYSDNRDDG